MTCPHCGCGSRRTRPTKEEFKAQYNVGDKIKHHEWAPVWTITAIGEERFLHRNAIKPKNECVSKCDAYDWIRADDGKRGDGGGNEKEKS